MNTRTDARTKRAKFLAGLLLVVMGLVSISVTLPYLSGGSGWDAGVPWVATGCGVLATAGGLWWLAQSRRNPSSSPRAKERVLRGRGGSFNFSVALLGVCVLMLVVAVLFLEQPTVSTGLPSLLAFSLVNGLFVVPPEDVTPSPMPDGGPSGNTGS